MFNYTLKQLKERAETVDAHHNALVNLSEISNYYDLLAHIKEYSEFFITNHIIEHSFLSQFPPDTLASLNIFLHGANNLLLDKRNFTALVWNAGLDTDVFDDSVAGIKVFGTGYLEANLTGRTATAIKVYGKGTVEVTAKDNAVANVSLYQKSNSKIKNFGDSIVMVLNNSKGHHEFIGNDQLILK